MKALVYGINGQDGYYLNTLLQENNIEVIGVSRSNTKWNIGDVADRDAVERLMKEHKPEYCFHLAANSTTSHDVAFENHATIATGTLNILEAAYKHSPQTKIFLSGSAVQFENKGKPIDETTPFEALSPYAVSRIASIYTGRYYRLKGLEVYVGYFFNHDSPLRTERHVNQKVIAAVKRIANGSKEILEIGDLSTTKEFNFAGDSVEAIWLLINQTKYFEAVVGCGKAYSIEDWVKISFKLAGLDWQKHVKENKDFKSEYNTLVSNPALLYSMGWQPKENIESLAEIMYRHNQN